MTRSQKILDVIDAGLQTPKPDPSFGEFSEVVTDDCVRCGRARFEESEFCVGCRAFLLGDGDDPMVRRSALEVWWERNFEWHYCTWYLSRRILEMGGWEVVAADVRHRLVEQDACPAGPVTLEVVERDTSPHWDGVMLRLMWAEPKAAPEVVEYEWTGVVTVRGIPVGDQRVESFMRPCLICDHENDVARHWRCVMCDNLLGYTPDAIENLRGR